MAVRAARFAHCIARRPVDYRPKSPFSPSVQAPLDFSARIAHLYTLDHELDRAVLGPVEYATVFREGVEGLGTPWENLGEGWSDQPPGTHPRGPEGPRRDAGAQLRRFSTNALRLMAEPSRFRPPWTLGLLQDLHASLFEGVDLGTPVGEFRRHAFTARDADGEAVYEAAPPDRISADLDTVLDWLDRFGATYQPLIPATVLDQAVYSIRPFGAGSGMVGQTLALLYLRHHGLPNVGMTPMGTVIRSSSDLTAQLLLWAEATGSYTELLDHQLDVVLRAYAEAARRWLREPEPTARLEEVQLRLLARARRERGWFSAHDATRWVGAHSEQTVLRHLNALVDLGLLESLGRTRGKRFRVASVPAPTVPEDRPDRAAHRTPRPRDPLSSPGRDAPRS